MKRIQLILLLALCTVGSVKAQQMPITIVLVDDQLLSNAILDSLDENSAFIRIDDRPVSLRLDSIKAVQLRGSSNILRWTVGGFLVGAVVGAVIGVLVDDANREPPTTYYSYTGSGASQIVGGTEGKESNYKITIAVVGGIVGGGLGAGLNSKPTVTRVDLSGHSVAAKRVVLARYVPK